MNKYTIYKLTCPNGKIYIGKTIRNVNKRFGHGCNYRNNPPFYGYIKEVGWENIIVEIIAKDLDSDQSRIIETENIEKYQSFLEEKGFNRSKGEGTLGRNRPEHEKQKISNSMKGEKCYWYGKGKRHSSKIEHKGKFYTNSKVGRPIVMLSLENEFIKEYPLISLASYENNILSSVICLCCKGRKLSGGGYKWKYKEDYYGTK